LSLNNEISNLPYLSKDGKKTFISFFYFQFLIQLMARRKEKMLHLKA
jgi:hypothetical protein